MKKIILITLVFCGIILSSSAQVFNDPHTVLCLQNHYRQKNLNLDKIELTASETILYFTYIVDSEWINISINAYLQDVNSLEKYKFIRAEGIPISPNKRVFKSGGQEIQFSLYFERLPKDLLFFDMIECETSSCFNIYNISLDVNYVQGQAYNRYLKETIPQIFWEFFYSPVGQMYSNRFFDDVTYDDLLKMDNVFNLKSIYIDAKANSPCQKRLISFTYNKNSVLTMFRINGSQHKLEFIKIKFETKNEASNFFKSFCNFFHMKRQNNNHYTHPVDTEFGRFVILENSEVNIYTTI